MRRDTYHQEMTDVDGVTETANPGIEAATALKYECQGNQQYERPKEQQCSIQFPQRYQEIT